MVQFAEEFPCIDRGYDGVSVVPGFQYREHSSKEVRVYHETLVDIVAYEYVPSTEPENKPIYRLSIKDYIL